MSCNVLENMRQGADLNRVVVGDGFLMLPMQLGHYTNVAAPLVVDGITEYFQCFDQLVCAEIARQLHSDSTSSLTKWRRDNFRYLFHVVEMALDSVFNHLTQISQVIGFGGNSMTESGSDKASIDRILWLQRR
jgi:hypothetical protein